MLAETFLRHLTNDAARLREVAGRDLDARVPSCPDWDMRALVDHVAMVYRHKVACMRLGRRPSEDEYARNGSPDDVLAWFDEALETLLHELSSRDPASPSYTWFSPDQTVGFWHRRMAQETAVHRYDAELAVGDPTPIDADLAVDGVDELLVVFLAADWMADVPPTPDASRRTVLVRTGARSWRVTLAPDALPVLADPADAVADLVVDGQPSDVLLWLWGGRVGDEVVRFTGQTDVAAELRTRLDVATD